jgi:transcriptional regulator with XRE-family HTH domain
MGAFLAALRKANGYTQQEVADKLNVSNKTVSKWECDDGCPEIMMLPVIAELYSVTVDEILKGERITKTETETKPENTEKRAKYLIERALTQYKNKSIIAITLSVVGAILPYFVSMIFSYDYIFIPIILTIALIAASVIIMVIANNNLKSNLYTNDIVDEETLKDIKQTSIKYISLIILFPIISFIGLTFIITGFDYMAFWFLPLSVLIATAIVYPSYKNKLKNENIEIKRNEKNIARRKKFIKRTVIVDIAIVLAFALGSAVVSYLNTQNETTIFNFKDAVNYQYETLEEAEKDYYKIYNTFVNEKPLYRLDSVDYDNLTVSGTTIYFISTQEENGAYRFIDFIEDESFDYNFKTKEELNDYVIENIYDEQKAVYIDSLCTLGNYIIFDNDTLTITEHNTMNNFTNEFLDTYNIDVFIISTCFAFGATVISVILYFRKRK